MKCIKCGNELDEGVKFCNICGEAVVETPQVETPQVEAPVPVETTTQVETPSTVELPQDSVSEPSTPILDEIKKKATNKIEYGKNIALITLIITTLLFAFLYVNSMNNKKPCKCETLNNETTTKGTDKSTTANYAGNIDISGVTVKAEDDTEKTTNVKFINMTYVKPSGSYSKNRISLLFENHNDFLTSGTVYLNYYKDGTRLDSTIASYHLILPNSKFVVNIEPKIDEEFDSIDISYKTSLKTSGYNPVSFDNSNLKVERVKDKYSSQVDVTYTNDTDTKATYYPAIIYKKEGKEVGYYSTIISEIGKGETGKATFYDSNAPEYDEYEVFIQSAYTSNK